MKNTTPPTVNDTRHQMGNVLILRNARRITVAIDYHPEGEPYYTVQPITITPPIVPTPSMQRASWAGPAMDVNKL